MTGFLFLSCLASAVVITYLGGVVCDIVGVSLNKRTCRTWGSCTHMTVISYRDVNLMPQNHSSEELWLKQPRTHAT